MADWTVEEWKFAFSARGTEYEEEAYQRLGQYLSAYARPFLKRKAYLYPYLQEQSDADLYDLADQFVQQTLEKVWKHYNEFRWGSHVKTWATAILIHEIGQFLRLRSTGREVPFDIDDRNSPLNEDNNDCSIERRIWDVGQSEQTPENIFIEAEFISELEVELAKLSDKQRYAFMEVCLRDRSVLDVAQELKISVIAVYQQVSRARQILKKWAKEMGYRAMKGL